MSCYFRHIKGILEDAGVNVTGDNRRRIDEAIHQIVGVTYKDCPSTWKKLKAVLADEQAKLNFIRSVQKVVR